jgi:hypothetical protein
MRNLDIKYTGEVDNDMLYHNVLKFYLIDLVVVEISRHEVCFGSLFGGVRGTAGGCRNTLNLYN